MSSVQKSAFADRSEACRFAHAHAASLRPWADVSAVLLAKTGLAVEPTRCRAIARRAEAKLRKAIEGLAGSTEFSEILEILSEE